MDAVELELVTFDSPGRLDTASLWLQSLESIFGHHTTLVPSSLRHPGAPGAVHPALVLIPLGV